MKSIVDLVDAKKSPLSRIMTLFNGNDPSRRVFENNICATHIGDGYVVSVAHHLFGQVPILRCIPDTFLQGTILPKLTVPDQSTLKSKYQFDPGTKKWYFSGIDTDIPVAQPLFIQSGIDMRYLGLINNQICSPCLIFNFETKTFFDGTMDSNFDSTNYLFEAPLNKHTFLIELDLLWHDFRNDVSMYRFKSDLLPLSKIVPAIDVDYSICYEGDQDLYCLQGAPTDNLGRMVNKAIIEGYIDQFSSLGMFAGKTEFFEGFRYLIKGYFRFGSSGAPYVFLDKEKKEFVMNAIQSEACPQQLLIGNKRDGHAQYINAIASPLINVKDRIKTTKPNEPVHSVAPKGGA